MKKYIIEISVWLVQVLLFYLLPIFAGPTDTMGLVLLLLASTSGLSLVVGTFSEQKGKYLYPLAVSLAFVPSVYIYYNETALVHAVWYLVMSAIGVLIGIALRRIVRCTIK